MALLPYPGVMETPSDMQSIEIRDESIRLGQLLKLASVVDDGAHARTLIETGEVRVDGSVETRRGAQVHLGSVVETAGQRLLVVSNR